jgi:hypothetical protein
MHVLRRALAAPTFLIPLKKRMGAERIRKILLVSVHIRWLIAIRIAAFIAPDREVAIESREWHYGVCFAQRDSVAAKKVLPHMKPMIFAEYHPAIIAIFPHRNLLWGTNSGLGLPTLADRGSTWDRFALSR